VAGSVAIHLKHTAAASAVLSRETKYGDFVHASESFEVDTCANWPNGGILTMSSKSTGVNLADASYGAAFFKSDPAGPITDCE